MHDIGQASAQYWRKEIIIAHLDLEVKASTRLLKHCLFKTSAHAFGAENIHPAKGVAGLQHHRDRGQANISRPHQHQDKTSSRNLVPVPAVALRTHRFHRQHGYPTERCMNLHGRPAIQRARLRSRRISPSDPSQSSLPAGCSRRSLQGCALNMSSHSKPYGPHPATTLHHLTNANTV